MQVFAFEYCECVYESAYSVESLHTTKAGAWRALRKKVWEKAIKAREDSLRYGFDFTRLQSQSWRVVPHEIHQD